MFSPRQGIGTPSRGRVSEGLNHGRPGAELPAFQTNLRCGFCLAWLWRWNGGHESLESKMPERIYNVLSLGAGVQSTTVYLMSCLGESTHSSS